MGKRAATTGYVVAWLISVVAFVVLWNTSRAQGSPSGVALLGATPVSTAAWLVIAIATLAMLVMWIAALFALGQAHAWGWLAALLILQLIGLGIIGMIAYAMAGPSYERAVFTRPSVT
jgi:hypothetical protein